MYDIIVIGAGPAGLTSALYGLRANKKVLVLESKSYGGQIVYASSIENYPGIESISGVDFATNLYNQVKKLNGEVKFETVIKIDKDKKVTTKSNEYYGKSIIIATGFQNKKLNIKNEDKLLGKGVSYCATCDGNFYKGKIVSIVGGGNTALEDALYLSNIVKKVYLIHRRDSFKGENKYIEEINNKDNIEVILNRNVVKLNGSEKLESITLDNNQELDVDGIFIAIGQIPNSEIFKGVIDIDCDGYIKTDDNVHTNVDKIYVAGDARRKELRQLTTAVSDGSMAAYAAIKEMESNYGSSRN